MFTGRAPPKVKRHSNAGFSLLEMVIVVAISLVLAGISIPIFTNVMKSYYQSATVSATTGAISAARMQAIMHGCSYQVIFTPAALTYQVFSEVPAIGTAGCLTTFALVTTQIGSSTTPLPKAGSVTMTGLVGGTPIGGTTVTYTFAANGTVTVVPTATTLQIKNTVNSNTVTVNGVGYVSITSP
jgi:prepilin-type N-terminal cleavage/methylation domain-containing protein